MLKDCSVNQKGSVHILLLASAIGIVGFLALLYYSPFSDDLLSTLYPKSSSRAAGGINEALDFCINGSNTSYPLDATLVSPGGNIQNALNTSKKVRLLPGNYNSSTKLILSSGMHLYGVRGENTTLVPKIEIQPGSTDVIVSNIFSYDGLDFPASNLVTKNNCFVGVITPINIKQATLEDNIFLDITGQYNFDNRTGGYMKNNRFIRTRTIAPGDSVNWYGDPARVSDNNVMMFYNIIYKKGMHIDNQNNMSIVGLDAEGWNREGASDPALLEMGGMNHMRVFGWSGGLNTAGIPSLFDVGATLFQYINGYVDGGQTPDTIMRAANQSTGIMNVTNNASIQNQGTGNLFKAFTDGGTAISGTSNAAALRQLFIDPISSRTGEPWERPTFSTIPDPAPDWQTYRNTATDSTAYIQNLVNSATSVAFLPAGKYVISSPIIIPLNKGLIGAGSDKTVIIAKTSSINILQGQGSAAPTKVYIANMTLQGGNNGLIFSADNGMQDAQFNAAYFSNLTFRNNQTGFFIDRIWGLDNHLLDHLNFYQNGTALKQRARAGAEDGPGGTWSMGYQDKNVYYHNQYVGNTTVFDLQGERASVNNMWLNSLFLDNTNMGSMKNYVNTTFANSDFINNGNGANALFSNNSYDPRINCVSCNFQADSRGTVMLPSEITCEGCVFDRGTSTTATVIRASGTNKNFFYNTRSTMPMGGLTSGVLINSSFPESQYNQQGVSVINGTATTFLSGVPNPKPQLLFGSNLAGIQSSPTPVPSPTPTPTPLPTYGSGLKASYFADRELSALSKELIISSVNADFGTGSPDAALSPDDFSIRYEGNITPATTGSYTFHLASDDGARLYINNQLVIDNWGPTPTGIEEPASTPITLTAGQKTPIKVEYQEMGGPGSVVLSWTGPSIAKQIIPASVLSFGNAPIVGNGDGLIGSYFGVNDLTGSPLFTKVDAKVDSDFGAGSPDNRMPVDSFSIRWDGFVQAPATSDYTFSLASDDGARLYVNNQLVIDNWGPTPTGLEDISSTPITLQAGTKTPIRVEYQELGGPGKIQLNWSSTSLTKQVIPQNQLYTSLTSSASPSLAPAASQTASATPAASIKPGDTDGNGNIDIFDYNTLLTNFGRTGTGLLGDFDNSGKVDIFDYNLLLTNFAK